MDIVFTIGSKPQRFASPALMWPVVDGRSYDFSGHPFNDGDKPLNADELNIVFDAADRLGIGRDRMFFIKDDIALNAPGC